MQTTVYAVIGIYEGLLENFELLKNEAEANRLAAEIKKKFDKRADKWEDEPEENMNYSVKVYPKTVDFKLALV